MNDVAKFHRRPPHRFVAVFAIALTIGTLGCRPSANRQATLPFGIGGNQSSSLFGNRTTGFGGFAAAGSSQNNSGSPQPFGGLFNQNSNSGSGYQSQAQTAAAYQSQGQTAANPFANNEIAGEIGSLNRRLGAFDADNQLLNTEVASLKQKLELSNQYSQALKQQLADSSQQIQQSQQQREDAARQVAALQSDLQSMNQRQAAYQSQQNSSGNNGYQQAGFSNSGNSTNGQFASYDGGRPGSATIRANNSLMRQLNEIQIPGGQARMDGDVIRIEFPTDRMFVSGSYQIQPGQLPLLKDIAATIRQSFPRQIVGIESHWDNTPLDPPGTTDHQLTATQALAVFDELVRLGLPSNQLFTMAMASNRPRYPNTVRGGVSPNRRIELVIYPETYDGS